MLSPSSVQETFWLTIDAFNLAERFRTPVILLYDEVIGHVRERVTLPVADSLSIVERPRPECSPDAYRPYAANGTGVPALADFGSGYRFHVTGLAHDERGYPTQDGAAVGRLQERLHAKLEGAREEIVSWETVEVEDADTLVVAFGISARAARQAVRIARGRGERLGLFRPRTLWPFPDRELRTLAEGVGAVMVAEMNMGQMLHEVERCVGGRAPVIPCLRADGQPMRPEDILAHAGAGAGGRKSQ